MRHKLLLVILEDVKREPLMSIHTTDESALDAINAWSEAYPEVTEWEHSNPNDVWTRTAPGLRAQIVPREMEGPTILMFGILPGDRVMVDLPRGSRVERVVESTTIEGDVYGRDLFFSARFR